MAKIKVAVQHNISDGSEIKFYAPCNFASVTELVVEFLDKYGNTLSQTFKFCDAEKNDLASLENLFAEGACVKVILSVTKGEAYIQNAVTNAYIENNYQRKSIKITTGELGNWEQTVINGNITFNSPASKTIAYGNGKYVAVGKAGGTIYSEDGINWYNGETICESNLYCIFYGNNMFIAGSYDGIFYSYDGISWVQGASADDEADMYSDFRDIRGIAYGNGKFVAIDYQGGFYYSTDGINWVAGGMVVNSAVSIAYGNGKFVILPASTNYDLYYSEDGINWTPTNIGLTSRGGGDQIIYGKDKFILLMTGRTYYSYDGISWVQGADSIGSSCESVAYGNDMYIIVGSGSNKKSYYSYDGITWTLVDDNNNISAYSIIYGKDKFIAVSYYGTYQRLFLEEEIDLEDTVIKHNKDIDNKAEKEHTHDTICATDSNNGYGIYEEIEYSMNGTESKKYYLVPMVEGNPSSNVTIGHLDYAPNIYGSQIREDGELLANKYLKRTDFNSQIGEIKNITNFTLNSNGTHEISNLNGAYLFISNQGGAVKDIGGIAFIIVTQYTSGCSYLPIVGGDAFKSGVKAEFPSAKTVKFNNTNSMDTYCRLYKIA